MMFDYVLTNKRKWMVSDCYYCRRVFVVGDRIISKKNSCSPIKRYHHKCAERLNII